MDANLKDMQFSIICKDGDANVKIKGSAIELAALIATIALSDQHLTQFWFMQENPKYRDGMQMALDKLKELDGKRDGTGQTPQ